MIERRRPRLDPRTTRQFPIRDGEDIGRVVIRPGLWPGRDDDAG